jgi:hypothetical protein
VTGTQGANNWYRRDVSVAWHWTDTGGSGIDNANCTQSSSSSGEGPAIVVSATCHDLAGNIGADSRTFKIDKTAPSFAPSNIAVDATSPAGATVTFSPTATDSGGSGPASVVCAPASGGIFPIGDTQVNCTATDGAGNTTASSFTIHVRSASEQLANLLAAVTGVGPGKGLQDKVRDIQNHLAHDKKIDGVCHSLDDFAHQVTDLAKGKNPKISPAQRDSFLGAQSNISAALDC